MKKLILLALMLVGVFVKAQTFTDSSGTEYQIISGDLLTTAHAYTRGAVSGRVNDAGSLSVDITPLQFRDHGYHLRDLIAKGDLIRISGVNLFYDRYWMDNYALSGPLANIRYTTINFSTSLENIDKVTFKFEFRQDTGEFIGIGVQRDEWTNEVRRTATANLYETFEAAILFFTQQVRLIN